MAKFQNKINFILIYFKKAINYSEYILKNQGFWGLVNGLKVISSIFYPTIGLFSSPLDVQVEITTKCNLSCTTCTHKSLKDKKDMTFSEFKQIIDQFPNAVHVILQGIGEPLMNREIYRMISYAKSRNIKPMIITHGGLLTKENLDQLIKSGLHGLTISIDGYGKNYEKIRPGANFNLLINNLKNFLIKRVPYTQINVVCTKKNVLDIPKLIDLAHDIGIKNIFLADLYPINEMVKKIALTKNDFPLINQYKQYAKKREVDLESGLIRFLKNEKIRSCIRPWLTIYIKINGDVTPCNLEGMIQDKQKINFGNIFKKNIKEIINNEKAKTFRKELIKEKPYYCENCPLY